MKTAVHFQGTVQTHRGIDTLSITELQIFQREITAFYSLSDEEIELFVNLITGTQTPDGGQVRIFGTSTKNLRERSWFELVKDVGIFTTRPVLEEDASIGENVAGLIRVHEELLDEPELSAAVLELANLVQLSITELSRLVRHATAFQRTKVRLARALAGHPGLIILCNPTSDLPPEVSLLFADLVRRVRRKRRMTILLFTSDIVLLERVADRIIFPDFHSGIMIENRLRGLLQKMLPFLKPRPAQLYQLSHNILSRSNSVQATGRIGITNKSDP